MNGELRRKEKLGSRVEIPGLCLFSPRRLPAVLGHDLASERDTGLEPVKSSLEGWRRTRRLIPQRPIQGVGFRAHECSTRVAAKGRDAHRGSGENRTPGARGHARFPTECGKPTSRVASRRGCSAQWDSPSVLVSVTTSRAARGNRTPTSALATPRPTFGPWPRTTLMQRSREELNLHSLAG